MKTAMMVTTALVGASLIAGPAFASDPPELKMSGHARAELWFGSQDDESDRGDRSPHMETDDAEISFDAKATADNGLLYGLHMELDMDDAGDRVDEANVFFEGNWGRLELGDQDGAEDVMLYGGTNNLVANGGYDGGAGSFFDFNGVSASSPDMAGDTGDATKITYFTPRFGGFQVGVSYTPDDDHNFTESLASADGTNEHHFGLAANYVESFNGVDVAVGGSIVTADQEGGTLRPLPLMMRRAITSASTSVTPASPSAPAMAITAIPTSRPAAAPTPANGGSWLSATKRGHGQPMPATSTASRTPVAARPTTRPTFSPSASTTSSRPALEPMPSSIISRSIRPDRETASTTRATCSWSARTSRSDGRPKLDLSRGSGIRHCPFFPVAGQGGNSPGNGPGTSGILGRMRYQPLPPFLALLLAGALAGLVVGCGDIRIEPAGEQLSDEELRKRNFGKLFGEDALVIGGPGKDQQASVNGIGVNAFLWRASLDTISFMPLASADPFGGVIITDWYSPPEARSERFKLNVYILGHDLRADGIRAAVFRQLQDGSGNWLDAAVDTATGTELENAILTRARQLRIAGLQ